MARAFARRSAVTLLCAGLCALRPASAQQKITPRGPDADEYAIYNLIGSTQFNRKGITKIVILDHTGMPGVLTTEMIDGELQFEGYLHKTVPGIRADTAADFYGKRKETDQLKKRLSLNVPYFLVTDEEAGGMFRTRGDGWSNFYKKYPGAQGMLFFSPV